MIAINTYRYLSFTKCYKCLLRTYPAFVQKFNIRKLHSTNNALAKMFMENENKYAYNIMQNYGYVIGFDTYRDSASLSQQNFRDIIEKNWSKETPQTIIQSFITLSEYCSQHNICISKNQFDNFIDILTDNIKFATDEELKAIIYALDKWPETESLRTRNYIEVWAALDDECFNRINKWSVDEMLSFMSLFYMLNLTKVSDFSRKCILKICSKMKKLTKPQVVQILFFIGIARKSPPDIHNVELYVQENFSEFTIDDIAIIAMGLFKSKTPIRNISLVSKIIDEIILNSRDIHEVSLASLLKIIRYSVRALDYNRIYDLLNCLQYEISRLSVMCNVHMALLGTTTLTLHEDCLTKIADTTAMSMATARLKDLERLALTFGTFNFKPKTKFCFLSMILNELRKAEREMEIQQHGRSLASCVAYLGLFGIYPVDLMNKVLSTEFLLNTYGKHCYTYGREILTIHNTGKIFAKNEIDNKLTDNQAVILAKKYTDYVPDENYKKQYTVAEKMFIDVIRVVRNIRGGEQFAIGHHVVTHYQRGDIFICYDHKGLPLPVDKAFLGKRFGNVIAPPDDNIWVALIIAGRNTIIQPTKTPTGHFTAKVRELKALGYNAALVSWNVYETLVKDEDKIEYLNALIKEALKCKCIEL